MIDSIKDWYNGYSVPISVTQNVRMYTPWAVMNYLNEAYAYENFEAENYWTKSGASTILQRLFTREKCLNSTISSKFLEIAISKTYELKTDHKISLFKYDWFLDTDNEVFFSYLLLNAGYLTAQKVSEGHIFSIPNAELLSEFVDVIPEDGEQCKAILYNLQKKSQLKIIEMIKQKDAEGIKEELSKSHIKCEDYSMNFNFFHLAVILGNKEVFETLWGSDCKAGLDFINDKVGGLKAIDYAFLLKDNEIMKVIGDYYEGKADVLVQTPGWLSTIFCGAHHNTASSGVVSGSLDFMKDAVLDAFCVKCIAKWSANVIASVASSFGVSTIEEQCSEYDEYNKIDISNPQQFDSLKQFEKYLLQHEEAHVVVNSNCVEQQTELSKLSYNIFENSFYSDEEVFFTLCDVPA